MIILAEITPLDTVAGTRKTVRATNANDQRVTGLNSLVWRPAISELPTLSMRLFKGDFDGTFAPAVGSMALQVDQLEGFDANVRRFLWQGASVKLWAGTLGQAWPWTQCFDGIVGEGPTAEDNKVSLPLKVNTEPFDADILTLTYAGTGGAEGPSDLKDKVKPWLLGRCLNAEPVLINGTYSIYQFSAYGAIQAVNALYERGSAFGAAAANYASYAALQAATIAPGAWATCLAEGLVRLGAPQYGVITGDVDGDAPSGTWRRKTGEIITRVATNAGASASLDATSLTDLDAALAGLSNLGRIGVYLTEQESLLDFAARLAAPCNAQAGISLMGDLFVARIGSIPAPSITLDAQQRQMPRVVASSESGVSPPFSFVQMGYAKSWRVHSGDEISYVAPPEAGATVGAPTGTLVGATAAETVEDGANAANAGVNADGTIKNDKVATAAMQTNSATLGGSFWKDYAGGLTIGSAATWKQIDNGVDAAEVSVATGPLTSQQVIINAVVGLRRAGGANDNLQFKMRRASDSAYLTQIYAVETTNDKMVQPFTFHDPDPPNSTTETYELYWYSDDSASPAYEVFLHTLLTKTG